MILERPMDNMTEAEAFCFLDEIKKEISDRLVGENPSLGQPENSGDLHAATELRFERMRAAFKIDEELTREYAFWDQRYAMAALQSDDSDPLPF
jgi:hypothetical protein